MACLELSVGGGGHLWLWPAPASLAKSFSKCCFEERARTILACSHINCSSTIHLLRFRELPSFRNIAFRNDVARIPSYRSDPRDYRFVHADLEPCRSKAAGGQRVVLRKPFPTDVSRLRQPISSEGMKRPQTHTIPDFPASHSIFRH